MVASFLLGGFVFRHEGVELNEHAVADPDQVANEVSAALLYT